MDSMSKTWRILNGYRFFLSLLIQGFFLHPCYRTSSSARMIRLSLMPITIWLAITSLKVRQFEPVEEFFHVNFSIISFSTFHAICLAIEYGLFDGDVLDCPRSNVEVTEKAEGQTKDLAQDLNDERRPDVTEERINQVDKSSSTFPSFGERIKFLVWLIFSPRGLQTSWAPATSVVPIGKKRTMKKFVLITIVKLILTHILFITNWMTGVSYAQNPEGVYGFWTQDLGIPDFPMLKFISRYFICSPFATSAWLLIDIVGYLFNLAEALFYYIGPKILPAELAPREWDSTLYPPLFNKPWNAGSMIDFWSRGWHAVFRQHIVFCGSKPLIWLFKPFGKDAYRLAGLIGGMAFSGIFHEFVLVSASRFDPTFATMRVFLICGIGMVCEIYFKRLTGHPVSGLLGKAWFGALLMFAGTAGIESWIERGLGRDGIPPLGEWRLLRFCIPFGPLLPEKTLDFISNCSKEVQTFFLSCFSVIFHFVSQFHPFKPL